MDNEIFRIKVLIPYCDEESSHPTEYSPYRIIEVVHDTILFEFAVIVLNSFDFKQPRPFGFYYNKIDNYLFAKEGYVIKSEEDDEWNTFDPQNIYGDINKGTVSDILTRRGKKWLLLFDYIKEWKIQISLVEKSKRKQNIKYPIIIEKHMKSPLQNEFQ